MRIRPAIRGRVCSVGRLFGEVGARRERDGRGEEMVVAEGKRRDRRRRRTRERKWLRRGKERA